MPIADIPGLMSSKKEEGDKEEDNGEGGEGMDVGDHSSRAGGKRKLDASERGIADHSDKDAADADGRPPPAKKQKPLCKYGPKCYQKNPTHREQFDHPWVSNFSTFTDATAQTL